MKTRIFYSSSLLVFIFIFSACKDKTFKKYQAYTPVYTSYENFRKPAEFKRPQSISQQGQIYIKDQFLFIIEPEKGIHFIDNSSPSSPQKTGFLSLLGCTGIEIKNQHLFANSFIDLVVFDISSMTNPKEISRVEDAFPEALPIRPNQVF